MTTSQPETSLLGHKTPLIATPLIAGIVTISTATSPVPAELGTRPQLDEHVPALTETGDRISSPLNVDLASDILKSPTVTRKSSQPTESHETISRSELDEALTETISRSELDEALAIVRSFSKLTYGWDEPNSLAPSSDVIDDALVVLQNWPGDEILPEPTAGVDGRIALEIYDNDGFSLGGVELVGENHAIYQLLSALKFWAQAGLIQDLRAKLFTLSLKSGMPWCYKKRPNTEAMRRSIDDFCNQSLNVEELATRHPCCECEHAASPDKSPGRVDSSEILRLFLTSRSDIDARSAAKRSRRPFRVQSLKKAYKNGLSISRLRYASAAGVRTECQNTV